MMSRCRPLAVSLCAAFTLSACTTVGPHRKVSSDGWEESTTYSCDWKPDSNFLWPGRVPNSPILPKTRSNPIGAMVLVVPVMLDLVVSPLAYYFDRDCREVSSSRRYVGTPEQHRRERLAQQERERKEAEENSAAARQRRAAEELARQERAAAESKRQAEQRELEALFPPLDESPRKEAVRPDDYALIVGIEGYRALPKATYAENDAASVKTYLQALGVPPQNVITLTGQSASRSDIAKYLEEWLPGVVKPDSRVYFYYSGHGAPDPTSGQAYLVPWDGDAAFLKSTAFPLATLYADLGKLPNKETVVMLDACFSGTGGRSVLADGVRPLVLLEDTSQPPEKAAVLAASGAREIAGGLDLRRHGLFTYFLLRGLSGEADAARSGHLTASALNDYLKNRVADTAHRANRDQHPRLLGDGALRLY